MSTTKLGNTTVTRDVLPCSCNSPDHFALLVREDGDNVNYVPPSLHISLFLGNYPNFFKRLKLAFNYLFRRPANNEGHYDVILVDETNIDIMLKFIEETKSKINDYKIQVSLNENNLKNIY